MRLLAGFGGSQGRSGGVQCGKNRAGLHEFSRPLRLRTRCQATLEVADNRLLEVLVDERSEEDHDGGRGQEAYEWRKRDKRLDRARTKTCAGGNAVTDLPHMNQGR